MQGYVTHIVDSFQKYLPNVAVCSLAAQHTTLELKNRGGFCFPQGSSIKPTLADYIEREPKQIECTWMVKPNKTSKCLGLTKGYCNMGNTKVKSSDCLKSAPQHNAVGST